MLTGPIFMLQVYDRVLTSRSEATLVALVVITAFLFLMMGLLDHARARLLARAAARFQARMDARVMGAILTRSAPATGLQDLEAMQRFASGPGPFAFFDAPWTPVFLGVLFIFHWLLGILAVASGVLLLSLALLNSARTARLQAQAGAKAGDFVEQLRAGAETMRGRAAQRSAGEHGGGVGPGRRLCGDVADAAPVPAVPDAEQVSALPGVDRGLFRIVAVEEVVRQAEMFQRRQLPFRRAGRRYQPSVGLAALGDDDLLAGPHACKQLGEVGAGLGDLVAGGRHGWFPTSWLAQTGRMPIPETMYNTVGHSQARTSDGLSAARNVPVRGAATSEAEAIAKWARSPIPGSGAVHCQGECVVPLMSHAPVCPA